MKNRLALLSAHVLMLLVACTAKTGHVNVSSSDEPTVANGLGWKLIDLRLEVNARSPERPSIRAELELELQGIEQSKGPLLFLNSIQPTHEFGDFSLPGHQVQVNLKNPDIPNMRFAQLTRTKPYERGERLKVTIPVDVLDPSGLLNYWSQEMIVVSWINAWYPTPFGGQSEAFWESMKTEAELSLFLPKGWKVVSSGTMVGKDDGLSTDQFQTWRIDPKKAVSFTAGPLQEEVYQIGTQMLSMFGATSNIKGQQERARTFLECVRLFSNWFGPAPYDYHSIVEVPFSVPGFYGASEQGYVLLKTQAFDDPLNSLAVLAHEAAHAWWAILVGVDYKSEGGLWMSEALAQYSAIMAIEEVYGEKEAKAFMLRGEGGFSRNHDATSFRRFVSEGRDHPIGQVPTDNSISNYLADSKGSWVYHMLRKRMGDKAFLLALKTLVEAYGNGIVSLDEWIEVFQRHTDRPLDTFFDQWLWRTGAPELVGQLISSETIEIKQEQYQQPYLLDLEVLVNYQDGTSEQLSLEIEDQTHILRRSKPIESFVIDPEQDVLTLRNDY